MSLPDQLPEHLQQLIDNLPTEELKDNYLKQWRVWDFLHYNRDFPLTSPSGVLVRFTQDQSGDQIRMHVEIEDDTTVDAIRSSWQFITEWRERLKAYQGADTEEAFSLFFFAYLRSLKEQGISYAEIADALNEDIVEYLKKGNDQLKIRGADRPSPTPIVCAVGLMQLMGLKDSEIREWVIQGLENIDNGLPVFTPDSPFDRDIVREKIRYPRVVRSTPVWTLYFDWLMDEVAESKNAD